MKWYEQPRIFYDWVRYGEDLDRKYARWLIQKTLDLNCDSLAFCVQVGGYALWESEVTPRYERMGDMDLIGELAHLCRENDLYFIPWWLATATGGVERVLREHPGWQLLGPPRQGKDQVRQNYICYNTPYRDLLYEEVREVLAQYEVDGIYFDQLPGSCYCSFCQAKFERQYGSRMPVVEDEFFVYNSPAGLPPQLKAFRDRSVRSFCQGIRQIIDETRPEVCYAQNWVRGVQSYLAEGLADVLLPEFYQKQDLVPLGLKQRLTKAYFDDGPVWGNVRHSVKHDARHHPLPGTRMLLVDCVANRSAPLMLDLCAMDFDATGCEELAETFAHIREMQEVQAGAQPVYYAALLHSSGSHRLFPERFDRAFEGLYRLLFEAHIPFELVTEAQVQKGELEKYRVLVLPDAVSLDDETVAAIRSSAEKGTGLVATHMSGLMDGRGNLRSQPALADLGGFVYEDVVAYDGARGSLQDPVLGLPDVDGAIFHYGSVRTEHPLGAGLPENGLFSFTGGFAVCRPTGGSEVIADVHALDQVSLSARPFNRRGLFPGPARWPLALARESGEFRSVYFAAQIEAEAKRSHAPELDVLMIRAIEWAGGDLPIVVVDCPRTVEVRLFHNPERRLFQLILVNLSTNPLIDVGYGPAVVRYVTPHKGLRLVLRTEERIVGATSQIGSQVNLEVTESGVEIELSRLDLYDSLLVEYG
jgi:hypothetical protein